MPVCRPGRQLVLRLWRGEERLVPGRYGIPEPDESCPEAALEDIDAALIPCLLCDRAGYRLGQGGGYYDRLLARCAPFTVALGLPGRLVDRVPREAHDRPVDLVLT